MCDLHVAGEPPAKFGELCGADQLLGLFSSPHDGRVFEVPNAGCASFHIEFSPGKWIFPAAGMRSPTVILEAWVDAALEAFSVTFAQGCHWG